MARKLVSYRLADDLQEALKVKASHEGISATELVNRLLRQGLNEEQSSAAPSGEVQRRVSQLEQLVHRLERRMSSDAGALSQVEPSPKPATDQIFALEEKLDTLIANVAEGCRGLKQLQVAVQRASSGGPALPPSSATVSSTELSPEEARSLATLRKLLNSVSVE